MTDHSSTARAMPERNFNPETAAERPLRYSATSEANEEHPERNEDVWLAEPERGVFGVFDGMGGGVAGDVAAQEAQAAVRQLLTKRSFASNDELRQFLLEAIQQADGVVAKVGRERFHTRHMGSTATLLGLIEVEGRSRALVANVADSRLWLLRGDQLQQATIDNLDPRDSAEDRTTMREAQARLNNVTDPDRLSPEDQTRFQYRNVIRHKVGDGNIQPAIGILELEPGDRLLLTTDGVHDNLTAAEMQQLLAESGEPQALTARLVAAAKERSRDATHRRHKPDDMTALLVERSSERQP